MEAGTFSAYKSTNLPCPQFIPRNEGIRDFKIDDECKKDIHFFITQKLFILNKSKEWSACIAYRDPLLLICSLGPPKMGQVQNGKMLNI